MQAVLLDFNGTMFFDSSLHLEAWSKIYRELSPGSPKAPDTSMFCGPRNDVILQNIAPWLTPQERTFYSERKEALYRQACLDHPEITQLVPGVEAFLDHLKTTGIPFGLASASIAANIDFFFETFALWRWFHREDVVYDDGTYPDKGAMHLEAVRRLGAAMEDCLILEDSPSSIRHALQNGAGRIVAVGATVSSEELLDMGITHHIRDFTEFDYSWLHRSSE
jgi:beta-phosphoglucomutase-like phosphatase (HAD superfamily)